MLRISPHGCYEWLLRMASALLLGFESDLSTYYSDCWCAGILPRLVVRAGVSGFDGAFIALVVLCYMYSRAWKLSLISSHSDRTLPPTKD